MQSLTTLDLNLQYPNHAVTMYAVQNDRLTRKISATLADGSVAWTPPSGSLAIVRFLKPDGTMGFYDTDENGDTAVTWTGNVATITLAEQVLTVAGDVWCQVNFYNSGEERLSTFKWVIKVQENVITDETIESTDYFNILTHQIDEIMEAITEMPAPSTTTPKMDGTASVGTETSFARGDHRHPTDTTRASTDVATTSANGLMSSSDKTKLDGIASGAQVNSITGVKGNAESNYRTGNVNITPANVGAVPTTQKINNKTLSSDVTLNASDIPNDSTVSGTKVDDALDTLGGILSGIDYSNVQSVTTANENVNDYTNGGIFYFSGSYTPTNKPSDSGTFGFLVVIKGSSLARMVQYWVDTTSSANAMWMRSNSTSTVSWGDWKKFVTGDFSAKEITPTIVGTLPTGVTAVGCLDVIQSGNVVTVTFAITRDTNNITSWANVATGLPVPKKVSLTGSAAVPMGESSVGDTYLNPLQLYVNSSGTLRIKYGKASSGTLQYLGSFTYITDEY